MSISLSEAVKNTGYSRTGLIRIMKMIGCEFVLTPWGKVGYQKHRINDEDFKKLLRYIQFQRKRKKDIEEWKGKA